MARVDSEASSTDPGAVPGPITVLGVDPTDRRALAELPRWLPADATALYRLPASDPPSATSRTLRANPPGLLLVAGRRFRRGAAEAGTLAAAVETAADERGAAVHVLEGAADPAVPRSSWWLAAAWLATLLSIAAVAIGAGLLALDGDLLATSLATLLAVGAVALLTGFAYAHEAAAIRRTDASIAALLADRVATRADASETDPRPVVVLPARNAAGVAAVLRERGVPADARTVLSDVDPT